MTKRPFFHDVPAWVADDAVFFLTICCQKRYFNSLANETSASAASESLLFYQNRNQWWVHLWLLMPDHTHGLISLGKDIDLEKTVMNWKRFITKRTGIKWQNDFFDHRIRNDESLEEKWNYILHNPVRAGLVKQEKDWQYVWLEGILRSE